MKGNRVVIPTSMRPVTLSRLHYEHQFKVSLQCFNVQDALSIGQTYRMTSQTWFTSVMNAKGMATRSPYLQRDRSQQHVQWKSSAWIWLTFQVNMP